MSLNLLSPDLFFFTPLKCRMLQESIGREECQVQNTTYLKSESN